MFALLAPKCTFGPQIHFLSILTILGHFFTFLLKITRKGFTRAYETQAASVLQESASLLHRAAGDASEAEPLSASGYDSSTGAIYLLSGAGL